MFTLILKNNKAEIEILTTRALLAIAGVAAFVYADQGNYYLNMALAGVLVLSSFFVKRILQYYKVNRLVLLVIAAAFTYITTHTIAFAIVLLVHGVFFQMLNKKVKLEFTETAITIHYVFHTKVIQWNELSNVVLKDRILTLDYTNDHLLQQEIAEESYAVDEKEFNQFCLARHTVV